MSLHELSVRRPVLATVFAIVIILFGFVGLRELGVREFPQAERPLISVSTNFPGANATVVENQITEVLEEEINTVSGIRTLTAVSREGRSTISIEFELGDDLDRAANDVRDRVAAALERLPDGADAPVVEKADADGDPIVFLNVRSEQRDLLDLTALADDVFKSSFETIPGVGRVDIWGDKEYAMRLWIDPDLMAAHGLTAIDIRDAFARANVELPTGRIEGRAVDLNIRTLSRLGSDPEEFNNRVIKRAGDRVVRFSDIGRAEIGPLNERTILKRDGIPMVGVVLRPQTGANQIAIVDEFNRRLERIKPDLPEDVELGIGFDTSRFIRDSISEVRQTLFIALLLVTGTIFFFLREVRTTFIPVLTIPVALIGTFFALFVAGFSINVLTLLGLVLAIGLVVDDAIVVLENIYKRIEQGMEPREAALDGVKEIFFAVISTTLALVAVFAPIIFLGGLTGALFREFGVTMASAVVISSFVALTLTPMLCANLLRKRTHHSKVYQWTEPMFQSLTSNYKATLHWFLESRWIAPLVLITCLAISFLIFRDLPRELAPLEDRGILVLSVSGPQGVGYNYMLDAMDTVDAKVAQTLSPADLDARLTVTSPGFGAATTVNSGFSRVILTPMQERERSQMEIASELGRALRTIPEVDAFVRQPATINVGGRRGLPVQFVVRNNDLDKLRSVIPQFLAAAREHPDLGFVDVDLKFNQPEVVLDINRDRAEVMGVDVRAVADTIRASFSGQRFGYFLKDGQQYEIIGQFTADGRAEPDAISHLHVRSNSGELIPLNNLVTIEERTAAPVLYRYDRFTAATFSANPADGVALGDAVAAMREVAEQVLDDSFNTSLAGEARELQETSGSLGFIFVMALALVYLVLSAQFESFRHPLTILITVPLALTGGLLALWYFNMSLNIFSQIGLVMLIGLVTKNGILIVEFANQQLAKGKSIRDAIEFAASARLRPVLMTTFSTILGTLPIALALGAGSQSRIPLGLAVIGGLLLGSMLTLYVIPAVYLRLAPKSQTVDD